MLSFEEYILEYRHNLADGTPKPSIQAHNGKNPNSINKKKLHTVGPYKAKNNIVTRPGAMMIGPQLTNFLASYNLQFKEGKTSQIKNSPNAIQMYTNPQGQQVGKIIQTK
jgi:hypothetical protein